MTEHADVFRNGFSGRLLSVSINQESVIVLLLYHCSICIVSLPEEQIRELLLSSAHLSLLTENDSVTGKQRHNLRKISFYQLIIKIQNRPAADTQPARPSSVPLLSPSETQTFSRAEREEVRLCTIILEVRLVHSKSLLCH